MKKHLLSFELTKDKEQLNIHGDEEGLKLLIHHLERLIAHTKQEHFDHDHLMTPAWSGCELSESNQGGIVLNHIKIYCHKGKIPQR